LGDITYIGNRSDCGEHGGKKWETLLQFTSAVISGDLASLDLPDCFNKARLEREMKQLKEYVKERDLDVKTASDLASALGWENNVGCCLFRDHAQMHPLRDLSAHCAT